MTIFFFLQLRRRSLPLTVWWARCSHSRSQPDPAKQGKDSNRRWQLANCDSVPNRGSFQQMGAPEAGRVAKRVWVCEQLAKRCQVVLHAIVVRLYRQKLQLCIRRQLLVSGRLARPVPLRLGRGGSTLRRLLGAHACSRGTYLFLSHTLLTNVR